MMDYQGMCKSMSSQEITTDAGEIEERCKQTQRGKYEESP
jgi:hypothetical protein